MASSVRLPPLKVNSVSAPFLRSPLLSNEITPVTPRPYRAFQGWRYLQPKDAPADLGSSSGAADMPEELRRELSELGLL